MRPGCGLAVVSEWTVETPERQRATIQAFADVWAGQPWPEGMLACLLLASTDGRTVAVYGQWLTEELYQKGLESHLRPRARLVDQQVPGIVRGTPAFYRLHRSRVRETGAVPGCIVLIQFDFAEPGAARLKEFVTTVCRIVDHLPAPAEGALGGHFHVSYDGLHVLNFAEWTSVDAHQRAVEGPLRVGSGPEWTPLRTFPGLQGSHFQRFTLGLNLARPDRAQA